MPHDSNLYPFLCVEVEGIEHGIRKIVLIWVSSMGKARSKQLHIYDLFMQGQF